MNDFMKTVISLTESGLLVKGGTEAIQMRTKGRISQYLIRYIRY